MMFALARSRPENRDWESVFKTWAKAPSQTEQEKCERAERMVKSAIASSAKLAKRTTRVFAQGSYASRTNVRQDSDVDICVCCDDAWYSTYQDGIKPEETGYGTSSFNLREFKDEVEEALCEYFGSSSVTRGNKAIDVHSNTNRVDADVVPTCQQRHHYRRSGTIYYAKGTHLRPDRGDDIVNWPQQNYDNGVSKNTRTSRRYKDLVRIFKNLRNEMKENGYSEADPIPSFLLECLVWNAPDPLFQRDSYKNDIRRVLAYLFNETRKDEDCEDWKEVNDLKFLFRSSQPWTRTETNRFLGAAWDYIGYDN